MNFERREEIYSLRQSFVTNAAFLVQAPFPGYPGSADWLLATPNLHVSLLRQIIEQHAIAYKNKAEIAISDHGCTICPVRHLLHNSRTWNLCI